MDKKEQRSFRANYIFIIAAILLPILFRPSNGMELATTILIVLFGVAAAAELFYEWRKQKKHSEETKND
ncbi:hypothetical protein [Lactobacillus corticis]|uniref:Uncharacterized protein n=1 Tax=Lactobacillus corticis TaxID=2201249 RepID=A0A916VJ64_9LACO|nr:hypothetical protein [Lactobacillus corticis]GFZ27179.1 hypothetical protein LCB40_10590 [Lactobacillus corticis]